MKEPSSKAMKPLDEARLARLVGSTRWLAMATRGSGGEPLVSWVAWAPEADFSAFYLHLSRLARHTRNLLENGAISLALSEPDDGRADPQTLARLTLDGRVEALAPGEEGYEPARRCYLERLPEAEMLFQFSDFILFRFVPERGRYVEGFASSHRIDAGRLTAVAHLQS